MREGYAVQILKWGEPILTIERNMLAGADLSYEDEEAIRDGAEHLKAFVGEPCDHTWIDVRNERVLSGEMCSKCNLLRAGNAAT